jgi:integrase
LYAIGIRRAEVASLDLGDVDLERRVMRVIGKGDGRGNQIEAAGPVALIFKRPISDLAEAMKKDGAREGVSRLAFVESG